MTFAPLVLERPRAFGGKASLSEQPVGLHPYLQTGLRQVPAAQAPSGL